PLIKKLVKEYGPLLKSGYIDLGNTSGYRKAAHEAAATNGLHLAEALPYLFKMNQTASFPEQLKLINQYSRQFGFKIGVDFKDTGGNVQPIDRRKANGAIFNRAFLMLISDFEYMPVEVVRAAGLKHLRIVQDFVDPNQRVNNIAAEAITPDTIDINLSDILADRPQDVRHELGHIFDYSFCGDSGFNYYDPQYTDLNPAGFEYGTSGYWQNATISQYGASNQREDKAEMFAHIFGGIDMAAVNSRHVAIRQKYDLLLARLNQKVPGAVEYFKQISR
ncbi:MAG TPA: hypothetical protein VFK97_01745, partial [Candidatus Saccharimonadales bacterium]|nr:hypothetical protein [Candidatus Saccharimonadales bacterium]